MLPSETIRRIYREMEGMLRRYRLPLRNRAWRGGIGNLRGIGSGSSIDFQDHRPYLPGDDPRTIDWLAYARSGSYHSKVYHEEVSPNIDLALDVSPSMFLTSDKGERALELFSFALSYGLQSRGGIRLYLVNGGVVHPLQVNEALAEDRFAALMEGVCVQGEGALQLERIPWRGGSLRILVSDLLFEGPPVVAPLANQKGRGLIWVPYSRAGESEPTWEGNLEFLDCEGGARRVQKVERALLTAYREAYRRHFDLWREEARRYGVGLARFASDDGFAEALGEEAIPMGVIEAV